MALVDRRPKCARCGGKHYCARCLDKSAEDSVIADVEHATRADVAEWLESRAQRLERESNEAHAAGPRDRDEAMRSIVAMQTLMDAARDTRQGRAP